jgi:hypothetical protein
MGSEPAQLQQRHPSPMRLLLLAAILLLSVACGGGSHTLHGSLTLTSSSGISRSGSNCSGTGGYSDLTEGAAVTVKNESGTVIATGSLDEGVSDAIYPTVVCHFSFTIPNVPDAKFYSVEVTHRGALTYSADHLKSDGWKVDASIGD